jgi:3-phenylpropionate/cinnamic acid dioxygenase small subunit
MLRLARDRLLRSPDGDERRPLVTDGTMTRDATHLRAEIEQFYAWQMQALDDGRAEEWATTFTEDGEFAANAFPEPTVGREALTAAARQAHAAQASAGVVQRHWLGMLSVEPRDDGTVHARCYALVIGTELGGETALRRSTVCEDELVRAGDGWAVRRRSVTRDDLV